MRLPHTLRFTRDDTTFTAKGYAEVSDDTRFDAEGAHPGPRIYALLDAKGYGDSWTLQEGDRLECLDVPGIKGVVSHVLPVTSARTRKLHHIEVQAGM